MSKESTAVAELRSRLAEIEAEPRDQLRTVDPDTAFELGYQAAIRDLENHITTTPQR